MISAAHAQGCLEEVDFLYMPVDFKTGQNTGFAFVNATSNASARRLRNRFNGFSRWGVRALRHCNVSWAREDQQGLAANVERYRNSSVMHVTVVAEHKPMVLARGVEVCFPPPTKTLSPPHASFGAHAGKVAK